MAQAGHRSRARNSQNALIFSFVVCAIRGTSAVCRGASRRVRKEDMRRIAKATGASIVTTLADMEGNETFDPEVLGEAEEVGNNSAKQRGFIERTSG